MPFACEHPALGPAANQAAHMRGAIPVLRTKRLTLRAPALEDFPIYADIALSPRGRFFGIRSREDAWYDFAAMVANWMLHGHGVWTITDTSDGQLFGFVLIGFEPGDEMPELGFMLTEQAEGAGIAQEAAEAAKTYARDTLQLPGLVSYIDARNERSAALAQRLGAVLDREMTAHGETTLVYDHFRTSGA